MITVLESIRLSTEYLKNKGIESPRINAELLLANILNCKRLNLYLLFDRPLTDEEVVKYRELLKRRSKFEPLQYIVGDVEFYGLDFNVNPSVLIPRQETELLVEAIINIYKDAGQVNILDIGTGSGNIAVALAKNIAGSCITAVDISEDALKTAKENAALNSVEDKIEFICADFIKESVVPAYTSNISGQNVSRLAEAVSHYDVVVSNPPYISISDYETLRPELRNYEPKCALTDHDTGYLFYEVISCRAYKLLKPEGRLFFEVGKYQYTDVSRIMSENNFQDITIIKDYQSIERVISGIKL
jgi:release factor glutamine methyltransferase